MAQERLQYGLRAGASRNLPRGWFKSNEPIRQES
jgi:hypothetical protein